MRGISLFLAVVMTLQSGIAFAGESSGATRAFIRGWHSAAGKYQGKALGAELERLSADYRANLPENAEEAQAEFEAELSRRGYTPAQIARINESAQRVARTLADESLSEQQKQRIFTDELNGLTVATGSLLSGCHAFIGAGAALMVGSVIAIIWAIESEANWALRLGGGVVGAGGGVIGAGMVFLGWLAQSEGEC